MPAASMLNGGARRRSSSFLSLSSFDGEPHKRELNTTGAYELYISLAENERGEGVLRSLWKKRMRKSEWRLADFSTSGKKNGKKTRTSLLLFFFFFSLPAFHTPPP